MKNTDKDKNIILIGMPASGKSTVGVVIAKTLGMDFVDTDILIQREYGDTLQNIIDKEGNDFFHELENRILRDFDGENFVIATGGSAVYCDEGMASLRENGTVVYISVSFPTINARLHNIKTRGITLLDGETLEDLFNRRSPVYEKNADIIIDGEDCTVEEVVTKIVETL